MSRVVFVSPPFGGHLHPQLALARRVARDHDVVVFSTAGAAARIAASGLRPHVSVTADDAAIDAIVRGAAAAKNDPRALARQLRGNVALMHRFRAEFDAFCAAERPDLVIADFAAPVAGFTARERGIAWWTSHPSPSAIETPDGPPSYLGGWMPRAGVGGAVRDACGRAAVRATKLALHALFSKQLRRFGMPAMYRRDGTEALYAPACVLALGYRELEFATRWPPSVRFVGPAADVLDLPGYDGPPLGPGPNVLVTVGTQAPWFTERMADAVARAAREAPACTFVFTTGDANGSGCETRGNYVRVPYVRYETDASRYDLVVHHGGTGIMNACLRAGIPALVHPLDYDQFDCAARLIANGLARRVRRLTGLADLVTEALASPALRANARAFAERVAPRYDAPETVARLVDAFMERRARERSAAHPARETGAAAAGAFPDSGSFPPRAPS